MRRHRGLLLSVVLSAGLLLGLAVTNQLRPSLENPLVLRSLGGTLDPRAIGSAAVAWDTGWARLCRGSSTAAPFLPASRGSATIALEVALRSGDFALARDLLGSGSALDASTQATDRLALAGDWFGAAQVDMTPQEFTPAMWGTILFLAGQQAAATDRQAADRLLSQVERYTGDDGPLVSAELANCLQQWGRMDDAKREIRRAAPVVAQDPNGLSTLTSTFLPGDAGSTESSWIAADLAMPEYAV